MKIIYNLTLFLATKYKSFIFLMIVVFSIMLHYYYITSIFVSNLIKHLNPFLLITVSVQCSHNKTSNL